MSQSRTRSTRTRRRPILVVALLCAVSLIGAGAALGQDLQSRLDEKQSALAERKQEKGVLTTEISRYADQIDQLAGEVAVLRNREAAVQEQLDQVKAQLRREKDRLDLLKHHLRRSLNALRTRLVAIYRSDEPDVLTVILSSEGFDDLVNRYEYLRRIEERDSSIVDRVRVLRNDSRNTVERIEAARDEIAAKKAELVRTREQLESRQSELDAVRDRRADALGRVEGHIEELEGDISDIQGQIQQQIQAASSTTTPLPAGPIQGGSPGGMIWPVNGPITSPFCEQRAWESCHPGIDIGVPAGTPIRAAQTGTVILAAPTSGYGNYTCIDHGGGLSTCYAHQSSFATSVGAHVSQGDVIGYVGCTGLCFGDHLHFEVRVNGSPVDPLGYL